MRDSNVSIVFIYLNETLVSIILAVTKNGSKAFYFNKHILECFSFRRTLSCQREACPLGGGVQGVAQRRHV